MSTNNILISIVIAAAVLGGGYWLLTSSATTEDSMIPKASELPTGQVEKEDAGMIKDEGAMQKDEAMSAEGGSASGGMEKGGSYKPYAPEKLALASDGKVVLYFHADWCPICRPLDAEFKAGVPSGVHVLKVDYDTAMELKQKYGVTYQHTFVQVNAQGNLIAKWGDAFTAADVFARIK